MKEIFFVKQVNKYANIKSRNAILELQKPPKPLIRKQEGKAITLT